MMFDRHRVPVTIIAWFTFALAFALIVLLTYWAVYPYDPLTVHGATLTKRVVKQGDVLPIVVNYTKRMDIEGVGVRWFVDGISFATPPARGKLPPGNDLSLLREVEIPTTLPPGVYRLHNVITFQVNPVRSVDEEWDTTTFTVVPAVAHPDADQD